MGIPGFWKVADAFTQTGLSLTDVLLENKNVSVVVDGEGWLEECFNTPSVSSENERSASPSRERFFNVYAFVSRLKPFIQCKCQILIVFDGIWKPPFKRKRVLQNMESEKSIADYMAEYTEHINRFHMNDEQRDNKDPRFECCDKTKIFISERYNKALAVLESLNIEYLFVCAEAEAFCCHLQRTLTFTYVLSNDSDCLIYGATNILREFTKNGSPASEKDEYTITKTTLSKNVTKRKASFSPEALLLAGIILGGDYNQSGITSIGITKTMKLLEDPGFVDVVSAFEKSFFEQNTSYSELQSVFNDYIDSSCKQVFKRNDYVQKYKQQKWPSEFVLMHYVKPLFNKQTIVYKAAVSHKDMEVEVFENAVGNVSASWLHQTLHELFIVHFFDKWVDDKQQLKKMFKINKENESKYRVRYKSFIEGLPDVQVPLEVASPTKKSPTKVQLEIKEYPYYMWISKKIVSYFARPLVEFWEEEKTIMNSPKKLSPKKRKLNGVSVQKTTLDKLDFFSSHTTPKKPLLDASITPLLTANSALTQPLESAKRQLFLNSESELSSDEQEENMIESESETFKPLNSFQFQVPTVPETRFDLLETLFDDTESFVDAQDDSVQIIEPQNVLVNLPKLSPQAESDSNIKSSPEIIELSDSD